MIAANITSICDHFRACHLDWRIRVVDNSPDRRRLNSAIQYLLERPRYFYKVQAILDACERIPEAPVRSYKSDFGFRRSLSNIPALVQCFQLTENGPISCSRKTCATIPSFEAGIRHIAKHIWDHHCPHLSEYPPELVVEEIEGCLREGETSILVDELIEAGQDISLSKFRPNVNSSTHMYLSRLKQWKVLRHLRIVFARRYWKLQEFTKMTWNYDLKELCHGNHGEKMEAATLTLHDINSGKLPTSLDQIVHLINLSFSMARVLKRRGLLVSFRPTCADFQAWKKCLIGHFERDAFQLLVDEFWTDSIFSDTSVASYSYERGPEVPEPDLVLGESPVLSHLASISYETGPIGIPFDGLDTVAYTTTAARAETDFLATQSHCMPSIYPRLIDGDLISEGFQNPRLNTGFNLDNSVTSLLNGVAIHNDFDFSVFANLNRSYPRMEMEPSIFATGQSLTINNEQNHHVEETIRATHTVGYRENDLSNLGSLDASSLGFSSASCDNSASGFNLINVIRATVIFLQALIFLACMAIFISYVRN